METDGSCRPASRGPGRVGSHASRTVAWHHGGFPRPAPTTCSARMGSDLANDVPFLLPGADADHREPPRVGSDPANDAPRRTGAGSAGDRSSSRGSRVVESSTGQGMKAWERGE